MFCRDIGHHEFKSKRMLDLEMFRDFEIAEMSLFHSLPILTRGPTPVSEFPPSFPRL